MRPSSDSSLNDLTAAEGVGSRPQHCARPITPRRTHCYAPPVPDPGPDPNHLRIALPPDTYEIRDSNEGTLVIISAAEITPEVRLVFHDRSMAITFAKDLLDAVGVTGYGD